MTRPPVPAIFLLAVLPVVSAATAVAVEADYNADGAVNHRDLFGLAAHWRTVDLHYDLDGIPGLDERDLLLFVASWHGESPATPTATPTPLPDELHVPLPGGVTLELVRIPAGAFAMGSPGSERSRKADEGPLHTVTIGYDFYMGKYELTQAQWLAVAGGWPGASVGEAPSAEFGLGDGFPAYYISFYDLTDEGGYLAALNEQTAAVRPAGMAFRLPSEAEWEYACRAGTDTRFSFGDSLDCNDDCSDCAAGDRPGSRTDYMHYCAQGASSRPAGSLLPNAFGLYDMHGNVFERCQDAYVANYNSAPTDGSAREGAGDANRVRRGGAWNSGAIASRSANRADSAPGNRAVLTGFRVVLARTDGTPGPTDTPGTDTPTPTATPPDTPTEDELVIPLDGLPPGAKPLVLVRMPAGTLQMGSPPMEACRELTESPVHAVTFADAFYIGKYEVTQAQWETLVGYNPSAFPECGGDCPADSVSWGDCQRLLLVLNHLGYGTFSLPSEAQWEYACRAGGTGRYSFGDAGDCLCAAGYACSLAAYAWYDANSGSSGPRPVGQKQSNAWGLYDIHGNVAEWCADSWHASYVGAPADGSAWTDSGSSQRMVRGGHWSVPARGCRCAARIAQPLDRRGTDTGVRVVLRRP